MKFSSFVGLSLLIVINAKWAQAQDHAASTISTPSSPSLTVVNPNPDIIMLDSNTKQSALQHRVRLQHARDHVMPYVVSILVVTESFSSGEASRQVSSGSGTIISAQGHVLTNAHVVQSGKSFRVVMQDGTERKAKLIGEDTISDLAVIKIASEPNEKFGFVALKSDVRVETGDTVLAMGAPWGLSQSLSEGVVNNPNRLLASLFQDEADYEASLGPDQPTARYYAWIQHDAPISPGNSGGPLVDLDGQIVGVNTRGNSFGGDLAFAIPGADAAEIANKIIQFGLVPRAYFGFRLRSLKHTGFDRGVLINSVLDQSPAAKAGLLAGDRIIAINDQAINVPSPEDVPPIQRMFAEAKTDSPLVLRVVGASKAGKNISEREVNIIPVPMPKDRGDDGEIAKLGFTATELTPAMALRRKLDFSTGLLVNGIRAGGAAAIAKPALYSGDVIRRVGQKNIVSMRDVESIQLPIGKPVVLEFERSGERLLSVLIPQDIDKTNTPQNELSKPWAGVEVQAIPPTVAAVVGMPASGGFRITRLYADGPMAKAGAKVGDLIVGFDGTPIKAANETDVTPLQRRIRDALTDQPTSTSVWRDGKLLELKPSFIPAPLAENAMPTAKVSQLGIRIRQLSFFDKRKRRLQETQAGVLVEDVEQGRLGGLAHLAARDIVLAINGREVHDIDSFRDQFALALADQSNTPSIMVLRNNETRLLFVDRAWMED